MNYKKIYCSNAPAVLVSCKSFEESAERGIVIFYHGLGASKESNFTELEGIASVGFLAVGIDNVGHGERRESNFENLFSENNIDRVKNIYRYVKETAEEVEEIISFLMSKFSLKNPKISVCGISMGGCIAYLTPQYSNKINVVSSILGTPIWHNVGDNFQDRIILYKNVALLSQNGALDDIICASDVQRFHSILNETYHSANHKFVKYDWSGHFMREEDWYTACSLSVDWIKNHLNLKTTY